MKQFGYKYLQGANLMHKLTKPNNMTLTQTYEATRDLLTGMAYHRGSTLVAQRTYTYDLLGRPTTRNIARQGSVVNDIFAHNTRSELSSARVNGVSYGYAYDNIGNREFAVEGEKTAVYSANALNQYTRIVEDDESLFLPEFDADGNQTRVQTSTGSWAISYNNENRPTDFTAQDAEGNFTTVHCSYDYMGRRSYKKVISGGEVVLHQRYIYRGYLQIACIDLTRSNHPALWFITWDPTQPVATRPLAIRLNGTWFTYGWDLTKNIYEIFGPAGYPRTTYTYSPFGEVSASGDITQPIQWSSEMWDSELGLVYYNWRYYNPEKGKWILRDMVKEFINSEYNQYVYCKNSTIIEFDILGMEIYYTEKIRAVYEAAVIVYNATNDDFAKQKRKYDAAKGEKKRKLAPKEKEYGVRICCNAKKSFYIGKIGEGHEGAIYAKNIPPCNSNHRVVAIVHSHGGQSYGISPEDKKLSINGYLAKKNQPTSIPKYTWVAAVATRSGEMAIQLYTPRNNGYHTYKNNAWYDSNDKKNKKFNTAMKLTKHETI